MTDNEEFWRAIVTGDGGVMRRERRRHRRIPGAPRCKTCLVPLGGPAAPVVRLVLKRRPSTKNPNYCDVCETFVRTHPGGAEVVQEPTEQPYGRRDCAVRDPAGNLIRINELR